MRVLWFTNILMSDAAEAIGLPTGLVGGSWMTAHLRALREYAPDIEFLILTTHRVHRRASVGRVTYATFGNPHKMVFAGSVPSALEVEVRRLVSDFDPDLIHIHGTENFYARLSSVSLCDKPVLVSLQGIINGLHPHYNGNLSQDELSPFRTWRNHVFRDGVYNIQTYWASELSSQERKSLSSHKHYAGRTAWDRAWLAVFNPQAMYHHLDEAMRSEFYDIRRDHADIRRHSVYCSSAAGYPLKGLHWLLRAAGVLKRRFPAIQIRIANACRILSPRRGLIARLKDRDYAAYLRYLVRELGLQDNVVGLPPLSASGVAAELRHAHVFCLPSLCENSPNSLGEAMLAGVPCVATYVGGVPSILESQRDGLLCPAADPAALADAILRLFTDDVLAMRMAANARQTALARHDPRRIASQTRTAYETVREDR